MQSADLRERDDLAGAGRLDRSPVRCVPAQRQVRTRPVVVVEIRCEDPPQVPLVEDDHVVQAFPHDGPDHPFRKRILPRRPWGSDDFLDAHSNNASTKHGSVDAVAIPDYVAWCRVPREGFADLLCHPRRGWICRHTEMHDPPALMTKHDEGEESYVRKLVTELSGGVFGYLDSVLERHSFDEFGELI